MSNFEQIPSSENEKIPGKEGSNEEQQAHPPSQDGFVLENNIWRKLSKEELIERYGTPEEKEKFKNLQERKQVEEKIDQIDQRRREIDQEYEKLERAEYKIQPEHRSKLEALEKEHQELSNQAQELEKQLKEQGKTKETTKEQDSEIFDKSQEEPQEIIQEEIAEDKDKISEKDISAEEEEGEGKEKLSKHFNDKLAIIQEIIKKGTEQGNEITESDKRTVYKEAVELINDWLPFGHIDDFKGVQKLMEMIETNRPNSIQNFPWNKELLAQKISHEMGIQYKLWEKPNKNKTKTILKFVDKWLKDQSYPYQISEKIPETEISSLGKSILGKRDQTLSNLCQILATQNISFFDKDKSLRSLYDSIENKKIRNKTNKDLRKIMDLTEQEKVKKLIEFKDKFGTLPETPLKIDYLQEYIYARMNEDPEMSQTMQDIAAATHEVLGKENSINFLKKIGLRIEAIKDKESEAPKTVQQAVERIKKDSSFWKTIRGAAGFLGTGALLFIILFVLGELKAVDMLVGKSGDIAGTFGGKGKK